MAKKFYRLLLLSFLLHLSSQVNAQSSENEIQRSANQIYDSVMSPYCPGRTLSACPSDDARKLREEIFTWFQEGSSEAEVLGRLNTTYGDKVASVTSDPRVQRLSWMLPVAFSVVGTLVVFVILIRMRAQGDQISKLRKSDTSAPGPSAEELSAELRTKIEEELTQRMKR